MWKNYLTVAFRNLKRRPGYAAINGVGLAVGMACCLLIVLYVQEELSYDDFHEKANRTVLIGSTFDYRGVHLRRTSTPYPLARALEAEVPQVTEAARVDRTDPLRLSRDGQTFYEVDEGLYTEPSFFEVFSFRLLRGSPQEALAAPNSIVLTRPVARQIFGGENPLGESLRWQQQDTTLVLEVTGIAAEPPANTSVRFGALISLSTKAAGERDPAGWNRYAYRTFAVLKQEEDIHALSASLAAITEAHLEKEGGPTYELFPVPLTALHLSDLISEEGFTGTPRYVYLFGAVALIILLIACINYTNLATARAAGRAREVGVRKTAGATRFQLMRQFLGESVLLVLGALVLAVVLVEAALPVFNGLFGTHLDLVYSENALFLLALLGLVLVVGLIAGSYPALYLSSFEPTRVLKGETRRGRSGAWLRKGLVVVQFALSTALLIGTFVIYQQLNYMQTKDLGFDEERLVTVDLPAGRTWGLWGSLRREVLAHPGVVEAALANAAPGQIRFRLGTMVERLSAEAQADPKKHVMYVQVNAGYHFIEALDLHVIAGRGFSQRLTSDREFGYILNEAASKALGWAPEEAVGKSFGSEGAHNVIGVVEDFHVVSLHKEIEPVVLQPLPPGEVVSRQAMLIARLAPGAISGAMDHIEEQLARYAPGETFRYQFLDDLFDAQYRTERRLGRIFAVVAGITVLLACLGLFGLAAYAAERRTKEIGIRKVLGANVPSIVALLSKDFLKLVLVAFALAAPVAYWAMSTWLQDFAYRIDLGVGVFLLAGALALAIALLTVSYHAIRAALTDPVDALRSE